MRGRKCDQVSTCLARTQRQFADWRRTRPLGSRIPEPLWRSAVELAASLGIHPTAAALGLDYYSLQNRVQQHDSASASDGQCASDRRTTRARRTIFRPELRPAFVELASPVLAVPGECLIEFENAQGARMRVHLQGRDVPDVLALGRGFWESAR